MKEQLKVTKFVVVLVVRYPSSFEDDIITSSCLYDDLDSACSALAYLVGLYTCDGFSIVRTSIVSKLFKL